MAVREEGGTHEAAMGTAGATPRRLVSGRGGTRVGSTMISTFIGRSVGGGLAGGGQTRRCGLRADGGWGRGQIGKLRRGDEEWGRDRGRREGMARSSRLNEEKGLAGHRSKRSRW